MKLTELRKLETGTLLRLKGTDVIFKLHEVDTYDDKRPCCITVLEAGGQVLYGIAFTSGDLILDVNDGYYNSGWIYNNKTLMREAAEMTRYEFDEYVKQYRYVVTLRDLEVYEEDICARFDEHIDPRDLLTCRLSDAAEAEDESPIEPLPVSKARELVHAYEYDLDMIELINFNIELAAERGEHIVLLEAISPTISEAVKEKYRQAGYTVTKHAIEW